MHFYYSKIRITNTVVSVQEENVYDAFKTAVLKRKQNFIFQMHTHYSVIYHTIPVSQWGNYILIKRSQHNFKIEDKIKDFCFSWRCKSKCSPLQLLSYNIFLKNDELT